jgi:hypothetical protein
VAANLIKKPLRPNLNHSIPEVGTKQFNKGTNNGPKATHTLMDLGNMLLLPKLAKQREFDPCESWAAVVGEAQEKKEKRDALFGNDGLTKFWDFVGLNFPLVRILWPDPLSVMCRCSPEIQKPRQYNTFSM